MQPSAPHSLFSGDKQVNVLWRSQHLCRPLNTNHGSQPLGIVLGIEHGAGPRGLLSSTGGSKHITDFTVEVRVCWQFVEYEVPDAFYCVPVREGGDMKRPAELCYQWLHRDVAQYVARCLGWKSELRPWTQTRQKATLEPEGLFLWQHNQLPNVEFKIMATKICMS